MLHKLKGLPRDKASAEEAVQRVPRRDPEGDDRDKEPGEGRDSTKPLATFSTLSLDRRTRAITKAPPGGRAMRWRGTGGGAPRQFPTSANKGKEEK